MERVLVIGSPGAGKSRLATELARRTGLPLIHLDQLAWLPGWVELGEVDFRSRVAAAIAESRWVIDGNYGSTLPQRLARADTVIDLDLPAWRCLGRVLRRVVQSHGKVRADMAPGCPEQFDFPFLVYIVRFAGKGRRHVEACLDRYSGRRITLRSPADIRRFLDTVAVRT